ncbi:MAG TPA: nitrogenase component 1, partial [Bacillota bacterium]|nr:nitrogenase component 1 [Bacillota bacterium]
MSLIPAETPVQISEENLKNSVSTTNACKLCTPLGACLVFRGIEDAMPFLHGSQGCATYIRRYIISHFKEPMDIASSSFSETTAIYGGKANLQAGINNVTAQYHPSLIGVATTCLSETIGDDIKGMIHEYRRESAKETPLLVPISTPSYTGTHMDGFHAAVYGVVETLAEGGPKRTEQINLFPGLVSPADLRHLKEIVADFGLSPVLLPDYSATLDGPAIDVYEKIPAGGTPITKIRQMGQSAASIEFGQSLPQERSASHLLNERFEVKADRLNLPIGIRGTDAFFAALTAISGREVSDHHQQERGRLIDAYVDGHKYLFGK